MKQSYFIIFMAFISQLSFGQYSHSYLTSNPRKAKQLKKVQVYLYKDETSQKRKLVLEENYDSTGNIVNKIRYKSPSYTDFVLEEYKYDPSGRLLEWTIKNPSDNKTNAVLFHYGPDSMLSYKIY